MHINVADGHVFVPDADEAERAANPRAIPVRLRAAERVREDQRSAAR